MICSIDELDTREIDKWELLRSVCEDSLFLFVKHFWNQIESVPFIPNWHIEAICEHLQAVSTGQIKNLLINVPPGCSKSVLTSVFFPMWEWAKDPSVCWFFASYDQRLSIRDSVKCRSLVSSPLYQACWGKVFHFSQDENQKTFYKTNKGGWRLATSIGGHGTGEHPDRIVVDDANNVKKAESEQERQNVIDWWDLTMATRGITRNVRRVIIAQRLHSQDLSGHVLSKGNYIHICLPMRYEKDRMVTTPLGWNDPRTFEGELLAKDQFPEEKVVEQEKNLGAYGTAGQLMQRPVLRGGGMFKDWYFNNRVKAAPYDSKRIRYWDLAASHDAGCQTVGTLMAKDNDNNFYVEHVVVGHWEPSERDNHIVATAQRDRTKYGPKNEPTIYLEHEPGSAGVTAYKYIAGKLAGHKVMPDRPTGSKELRAEPLASQCAAGNVFLVEDGSWDIPEWVDEFTSFPKGKYMDRVDSASGGFGKLSAMRVVGGLKVLPLSDKSKKAALKIIVCSHDELPKVITDGKHFVLHVAAVDPGQVVEFARGFMPVDSLVMEFADIDPRDFQERWGEIVEPFGKKPEELVLTKDQGKRLWAFITKKREPPISLIVVSDNDDRRAFSIACGLSDTMRLTRGDTIHVMSDPEGDRTVKPGNEHVWTMVKSSRGMVM